MKSPKIKKLHSDLNREKAKASKAKADWQRAECRIEDIKIKLLNLGEL